LKRLPSSLSLGPLEEEREEGRESEKEGGREEEKYKRGRQEGKKGRARVRGIPGEESKDWKGQAASAGQILTS
jgi:hypothetical protein